MPWYTDNLGPLYARTPTGINVVSPFDETMSLSFNANGIDRETLNQILGINSKETNKMEAKKCDRCGKLYEKKFDKNDIQCVFKHEEPFFTGEEKNYSKEFIEDKKTHDVFVKRGNGDYIDMCPDCRKAFKTWFESADKEGKKNG
jgi:hypothetical protein